ncbi:MAG: hypothetical protein IPM60_05775 [Rhodospirillales bacterium]|nr:hypothetical protein [Rhodospirillales bacterium]
MQRADGYLLNSDDFLLPGAIGRLRTAWQENPDADVLLFRGWMVDGDGRPLREMVPTPLSVNALVHGRAVIVQQGFSFRMSTFRDIGGFNPCNCSCWDYEILCQLAQRRVGFRLCRDRIGVFRLHSGSLTGGVAGSAHEARYREDLERVHRNVLGRDPVWLMRLYRALGPAIKYLKQPTQALALAESRLLSRRLARRWQADNRDSKTERLFG